MKGAANVEQRQKPNPYQTVSDEDLAPLNGLMAQVRQRKQDLRRSEENIKEPNQTS